MRISNRSWTLALVVVAAVSCGQASETQEPAPGDVPEIVEEPAQPAVEEPVDDAIAPGPAADQGDESIDDLLAKRVSFDFVGASIPEIVEMIGMMTGAKIVIDPAIAADLENVPVTLKLADVSALDALNTLARICGGKKVDVRDGEVWLTTP